MTNEEAKQEAIKKAFKECGYEKLLSPNVNGWVKVKPDQYINPSFERLKINSNIHSIRPKSLKYLDSNNGWIRIEPDGSNLPTDKSVRYKACKGELIHNNSFTLSEILYLHKEYELNHYKPIKPEELPIY